MYGVLLCGVALWFSNRARRGCWYWYDIVIDIDVGILEDDALEEDALRNNKPSISTLNLGVQGCSFQT